MNRNVLTLIVAISLLAWSSGNVVEGAVIYDNGGPNQNNAYPIMMGDFSAEDFVLRENATLTDIHFFGTYIGDQTYISLSWIIYTDEFGMPGRMLAHGIATNIVEKYTGAYIAKSFPEIAYSFFLDKPIDLKGNINYWLALQFESKGGYFYWETTDKNPLAPAISGNGESWPGRIPSGLAFQLTNDIAPVPEPSTILLLGSGLAGLFGYGRRRMKT